jgi:hypothetical protein
LKLLVLRMLVKHKLVQNKPELEQNMPELHSLRMQVLRR